MDLMELLRGRRSYRRFEQREIPAEVIQEMLEAARLASSSRNSQPISYIVIQDPTKVKEVFALTRWAGYLPYEDGQPKEGEEPVLFVAVIQNHDIYKECGTDAGLAIANMTLAAWNRGVGSCMIGACNKPVLSEMFGLTENQSLHTVVGFGYPTHVSHLVDLEHPEDPDAVKYYLDENRDYVVPKRKLSDIVRYL